jgi:hypothetical protein
MSYDRARAAASDIGFRVVHDVGPAAELRVDVLLHAKYSPDNGAISVHCHHVLLYRYFRWLTEQFFLQHTVLATSIGRYVLLWDNKHSVIRKKVLRYQVFVTEPPADATETSCSSAT